MTVTDVSRYARGGRDPAALAAATSACKHWRVRVAHYGPQSVDAALTRHQLIALHKKMSWTRIADLLPITRRTLFHIARGDTMKVRRSTADAVEALWFDVCAPLERDRRRWPTAPLKEVVVGRYGSIQAVGNANLRRYAHLDDLTTNMAEDYADFLGMMPSEIWPDWYLAHG